MDINVIMTAISTVGFPIVCCIAMFVQNNKMSEAVNNNTIALTKISVKLGEDDK